MPVKQIDMLIEAGWEVLETDFNEQAFRIWRERVYECISALVGKDHPYSKHFEHNLARTKHTIVLSGVGVLNAAMMLQMQGDLTVSETWSCETFQEECEELHHRSSNELPSATQSAVSDNLPVNGWIHSPLRNQKYGCQNEITQSM